jgi:DNA-binding PadR family transcriptional regulator
LSNSDGAKSPVRITPAFFYLLLTLVDEERHGYAMAQEVQERSEGAIKLGPGSLYWSLGRLAAVGLIEEVPASSPVEPGTERRRYYRLTEPGRAVLKREAQTLSKVVKFARAKRVV